MEWTRPGNRLGTNRKLELVYQLTLIPRTYHTTKLNTTIIIVMILLSSILDYYQVFLFFSFSLSGFSLQQSICNLYSQLPFYTVRIFSYCSFFSRFYRFTFYCKAATTNTDCISSDSTLK